MLLRGAGAFATEGIKESEVLHKVQSEVCLSARCGLIDCIFRNAGDGVPYGVLFQRFVGNTVLSVPIFSFIPSVSQKRDSSP